jgi:Holliday junction DNA helicase RuvA
MIIAIEGKIEKKEPTFLHLNVNGIIYLINISVNCSVGIKESTIKLKITQIIKEDSNNLYGFVDLDEKNMFDLLIKVNGIGPKAALGVCSTFSPKTFASILMTSDIASLKRVPGVGPKSASRILVELNGTFNADSNKQTHIKEVTQALENLGFKKDKITKTLLKCNSTNTSDLIKEALKII